MATFAEFTAKKKQQKKQNETTGRTFAEFTAQRKGLTSKEESAESALSSPATVAKTVTPLSGGKKFMPTDVVGKYQATHGDNAILSQDPRYKMRFTNVELEQQKREAADDAIDELLGRQQAAQREMEFFDSGEFKGPQYLAAEQIYNQIQQQIAEENKKAMSQQQIDEIKAFQEMERWQSATGRKGFADASAYAKNDDLRYNVINRDPEAVAKSHEEAAKYNLDIAGVDMGHLEQMTDEEIGLYNYYYSTVGKEKADEYLASIESDLKARRMGDRREWYREYAEQNPVAASAFSVLTSPVRGLSYVGQAADYLKNGKMDANESYNIFTRAGSDIRGQVSSDIEKNVEGFWGKAGSFAYNTGMSMGDFLMAAGLSGGVGGIATTIMGTGAAAQTVLDAKDRGLNDDQAFALGTVAGFAEAATEKFSIEALLDRAAMGKGALTYILKNAITEGSEEAASGIINTVADILISKDKSEWAQSVEDYKSQGMGDKEAFWRAVADQAKSIGLDALGGMLSGGLIGSVGAIGNTAAQQAAQPKKGAEVATEMGIGKHGAEAAEKAGITPENVGAFTANYEAGKDGKAFEEVKTVQTGIDENVARQAFNAGQMDAIAEANTEQEVIENAEERNESGREGSERQIGMASAERSGGIPEGTGSTAERREARRLRAEEIRRAVEASGQVSTSAAAQGIAEGTTKNTMKIVPAKLWTDDVRKMVHRQSAKGVQVIPFVGEMEMRDESGVYTARGVVSRDGKRMWVCVDDLDVDFEQIEKHEDFHIAVKRDKKLLEKTRKAVVAKYTEEQLDQLVSMYVEAYGWGSLDEDYVLEEVLADAYAEIDAFEKTGMFEGATRFSGAVQEIVSKSKATKNATRKGGIKTSRGIQKTQAEITTEYQQTVDDILDGRKVVNGAVVMGYTPKLYQEMGMPSIPFVIGAGHIYSIAKTEAEAKQENKPIKGKHYHGLGDAAVKNLYEKVKDPVAIISAKDVDQNAKRLRSAHSVVAIVDLGTIDNSLLVPVEITAERTVNGQRMDVNVISTAYERDVRSLMDEAVAQENAGQIGIFYAKKEAASLIGAGVQFPKLRQATTASEGIVRQFSEKVNMNIVDQTQSLQFKDWFGNWQNNPQKASKVVDKNGEPLVVYHGTGAMFDAFDNAFTGQGNDQYGSGFYFTTDPSTSERYKSSEDGQVVPAFLNIRKPIVLNASETSSIYDVEVSAKDAAKIIALAPDIMDSENSILGDFFDEYWEVGPKKYMINQLANQYDWTFGTLATDIFRDYPTEFREAVNKALGYDGVEIDFESGEKHFVAWFPNQIKHATENTGEFSRTDDRFRRSRGLTQEQLDAFVQKYGAIEPGENPFRTVQVPKKTSDTEKVSKTIRTIMEAGVTPDAVIPKLEKLVAEGEFSYETITDKQAISDAQAKITEAGWEMAKDDWKKDAQKGAISKDHTVTGWALYNYAVTKGKLTEAVSIIQTMVGNQRNAAQALQATRVLKKMSPDAQLYGIQQSIERMQKEINERYQKRFKKGKAPELKVDEALYAKFLEAKTDKARAEVMAEIYSDIGRQMPSSFRDKANAWRYLAMLGNPRTHVRNIFGNAFFAPVVAAKNLTATGIEKAVSAVSGGKVGRSKAIVTGATKLDRALLSAAWGDFANVQGEIMSGGKYSDFQLANDAVEKGRSIYKNNGEWGKRADSNAAAKVVRKVTDVAWKIPETLRKKNSDLLDREDTWFSQPHYAAALASYCKANGITPETIAKGKSIDVARKYAIREAQKATYRDTSVFSNLLGNIKASEKHVVGKAANILIEGIMPFKKTPANILARGLEYSPLGLLKAITVDLVRVHNGDISGAEMIDNLSAGLTGSGLLALGAYLTAQGLIRGAGSGDDKENQFEELMGHQAYSLEIGGKSYTLDWLAPESIPFFVGANIVERMREQGEDLSMALIMDTIGQISDPMLEMSCIQGINDALETIAYAKNEGKSAVAALLSEAITSYITQYVPTLWGQIERTSQDRSYSTFTRKNEFLTSDQQYLIGSISARVPGDFQQVPYIDAWGRQELTGNVAQRAVNNFLNPAYVSNIKTSGMEEELLRLYEATDAGSVFPTKAPKSFPLNGETKYLTADEYVKYATQKGQVSYELVSNLVNTQTYKNMSDEDKAKAISEAYSFANVVAKKSVSNYTIKGWEEKAVAARKSVGISYAKYLEARVSVMGIKSLKDEDGETIDNSESLLKMEAIYKIPGLTDAQRAQLFEDFDIGKKVRGKNKAAVQEALEKMR